MMGRSLLTRSNKRIWGGLPGTENVFYFAGQDVLGYRNMRTRHTRVYSPSSLLPAAVGPDLQARIEALASRVRYSNWRAYRTGKRNRPKEE